jgi:hypothetical protein
MQRRIPVQLQREARLIDLVGRVRADLETLPPSKKLDDLVQKLREIETVDFDNPYYFGV